MERKAQWIVIFGLAGVLMFGGLVGLWVAASPSAVVPGIASHAGPAATARGAAPPATIGVVAYLATFTETGLPSGTLWFVNIAGQSSLAGTTSTISTLLADGSYSYTITSSNRSFAAPSNSFSVSGAPLSLTIGFSAVPIPAAYVGPTVGSLSLGEIVAIVAGAAVAFVAVIALVRAARSYRPMGTLRPPAA